MKPKFGMPPIKKKKTFKGKDKDKKNMLKDDSPLLMDNASKAKKDKDDWESRKAEVNLDLENVMLSGHEYDVQRPSICSKCCTITFIILGLLLACGSAGLYFGVVPKSVNLSLEIPKNSTTEIKEEIVVIE